MENGNVFEIAATKSSVTMGVELATRKPEREFSIPPENKILDIWCP
jgi:hypothetical protein